MTRKIHLLGAAALLLAGSSASAQVRTERYNAASMPDNSIVYMLPTTRLYAVATIEEVEEIPGEFALYAKRYLGVDDAVLKPGHTYRIKEVRLGSYGVPDETKRYSVRFRRNSSATYMTLTPDGILTGINKNVESVAELPTSRRGRPDKEQSFRSLTSMPPAFIQATSVAKRAEIAAQEIYRLRDSRTAIISGESDQPFPDGEAMKVAIGGLDAAEQSLTERFLGKRVVTEHRYVVPDLDPAKEGDRVAFRFSEMVGALPSDDLRGAPVYLRIKVTDAMAPLDEREWSKKERALSKGVVYAVPGQVSAQLLYEHDTLTERLFPVAQLGSLEVLEPVLFTTKGTLTAVTLDPTTGGLISVEAIQ